MEGGSDSRVAWLTEWLRAPGQEVGLLHRACLSILCWHLRRAPLRGRFSFQEQFRAAARNLSQPAFPSSPSLVLSPLRVGRGLSQTRRHTDFLAPGRTGANPGQWEGAERGWRGACAPGRALGGLVRCGCASRSRTMAAPRRGHAAAARQHAGPSWRRGAANHTVARREGAPTAVVGPVPGPPIAHAARGGRPTPRWLALRSGVARCGRVRTAVSRAALQRVLRRHGH
jgi:hypothetical protein